MISSALPGSWHFRRDRVCTAYSCGKELCQQASRQVSRQSSRQHRTCSTMLHVQTFAQTGPTRPLVLCYADRVTYSIGEPCGHLAPLSNVHVPGHVHQEQHCQYDVALRVGSLEGSPPNVHLHTCCQHSRQVHNHAVGLSCIQPGIHGLSQRGTLAEGTWLWHSNRTSLLLCKRPSMHKQ